MIWTFDKPTKPGWYWWRLKKQGWMGVHHIDEDLCVSTTEDHDSVDDINGEWAGPLVPPEER